MIDPDSNTGAGYGLAPIGHGYRRRSSRERISFMSNIVYQAGYSFERCREDIFQAIDAYFHELNMAWQDDVPDSCEGVTN